MQSDALTVPNSQGWGRGLVFTWVPPGQPPVARKRHRSPTVVGEGLLASLGDGGGGPIKLTSAEGSHPPLLNFYPWIVSGLTTSAIPLIEGSAQRVQAGHERGIIGALGGGL